MLEFIGNCVLVPYNYIISYIKSAKEAKEAEEKRLLEEAAKRKRANAKRLEEIQERQAAMAAIEEQQLAEAMAKVEDELAAKMQRFKDRHSGSITNLSDVTERRNRLLREREELKQIIQHGNYNELLTHRSTHTMIEYKGRSYPLQPLLREIMNVN